MQLLNLCLFLLSFGLAWCAAASAQVTRTWLMFVVPGVAAHEMAHYLVAFLTFGRPQPISLWPRREGNDWVMGSVSFCPNFFNGGLVALAPLYVLPPVAWFCWQSHMDAGPIGALALGYLAAVILYAAWPSRTDWVVAIRYPGLLFILCFAAISIGQDPTILRTL